MAGFNRKGRSTLWEGKNIRSIDYFSWKNVISTLLMPHKTKEDIFQVRCASGHHFVSLTWSLFVPLVEISREFAGHIWLQLDGCKQDHLINVITNMILDGKNEEKILELKFLPSSPGLYFTANGDVYNRQHKTRRLWIVFFGSREIRLWKDESFSLKN